MSSTINLTDQERHRSVILSRHGSVVAECTLAGYIAEHAPDPELLAIEITDLRTVGFNSDGCGWSLAWAPEQVHAPCDGCGEWFHRDDLAETYHGDSVCEDCAENRRMPVSDRAEHGTWHVGIGL
ncbi:MAG: hypothetical protein JOZ27_09535 [Caulobacteraceae bacterium]|nr:hypothetical protein [Caulobacteraceae bacterium]